MSKDISSSIDENTRRFYLEAMGIQRWQAIGASIESELDPEVLTVADSNREVTVSPWSQIESDIQQCQQCQLHAGRKQPILGRGNQSADLMFVVLAASPEDDMAATLCSGEAETLFSKMLSAIDIAIDDVYITGLLKCCVTQQHTISPKEIQSCGAYLKQQVALIQPRRIVVLGETAIQCLLQKNMSIDECRNMNNGLPQQFESIPLFFSYSPQELIVNPGDKRKAWSDLQLLQSLI